jgi:hypothetical protein
MPVSRLSVSLDEELAGVVRDAAAAEGVSLSAWISSAAQERVRDRLLRVALDGIAAEVGTLDMEAAGRLVDEARRGAIVPRARQSGD